MGGPICTCLFVFVQFWVMSHVLKCYDESVGSVGMGGRSSGSCFEQKEKHIRQTMPGHDYAWDCHGTAEKRPTVVGKGSRCQSRTSGFHHVQTRLFHSMASRKHPVLPSPAKGIDGFSAMTPLVPMLHRRSRGRSSCDPGLAAHDLSHAAWSRKRKSTKKEMKKDET